MELASIGILGILTAIDQLIWGPPLLVLLVWTGIFLTWKLGLIQIFRLPLALRYVLGSRKTEIGVQSDVSSFVAHSTALSATVGTGNIVGVATAIKTGGPGTIFRMLRAAFFGMAAIYSESLLAVKYSTVDVNGQISGGPMYCIRNELAEKRYSRVLAAAFAFLVDAAFFGIGTFPHLRKLLRKVVFLEQR